jgi:hypothetical protein
VNLIDLDFVQQVDNFNPIPGNSTGGLIPDGSSEVAVLEGVLPEYR